MADVTLLRSVESAIRERSVPVCVCLIGVGIWWVCAAHVNLTCDGVGRSVGCVCGSRVILRPYSFHPNQPTNDKNRSKGELNATACHGALQACSRLHQPDKAAWLIEEMRRRGPQPDAECYSLAIDTVARKGHWSVADGLLQSMRGAGLQPGPSGYGVVMAACHRAGQGERVLALLEEMDASGVEPPATAYATAVHAALAAKQHDKMLQVRSFDIGALWCW